MSRHISQWMYDRILRDMYMLRMLLGEEIAREALEFALTRAGWWPLSVEKAGKRNREEQGAQEN